MCLYWHNMRDTVVYCHHTVEKKKVKGAYKKSERYNNVCYFTYAVISQSLKNSFSFQIYSHSFTYNEIKTKLKSNV